MDIKTANLVGCKSFLEIGDLDISGNKLTVEATIVIKPNSLECPMTPFHDVISKHYDNLNVNYLLRPDHAEINTSQGFFATKPTTICENQAYHIAMVYDGKWLKFYKDDKFVDSIAVTGNMVQNNIPTTLGYTGGDNPNYFTQFWGLIDNVRFWKEARTLTQLRQFSFNDIDNTTNYPNLIASYNFNNNYENEVTNSYNGNPNNTNISRIEFKPDSIKIGEIEFPDSICFFENKLATFYQSIAFPSQTITWSLNDSQIGSNSYEKNIMANIIGENKLCVEISTQCHKYNICKLFYVKNIQIKEIKIQKCSDECIEYLGSSYCNQGIFEITKIGSLEQCDTIIFLQISDNPSDTTYLNYQICDGNVLTINNVVYMDNGTFIQNLTNSYGCDSLLVIQLNVEDTINIYYDIQLCEGDSIRILNKYYSNDGVYSFSLNSSLECDTLVTYKISIIPKINRFDTSNLCKNNQVIIDGNVYSSPGNYIVKLQTEKGCDSTIFIHVFDESFENLKIQDEYSICLGDSLYINLKSLRNRQYLNLEWNPSIICDTCEAVYIFPLTSSNHSLIISDKYGCQVKKSFSLNVKRDEKFDINNIVLFNSQNGNDKIKIYTSKSVKQVDHLKIYDRWGNLVYYESSIPNGLVQCNWNLMFKGQIIAKGVYTVVASIAYLDGYTKTYTDTITIFH